jgi:hypothetical protein
MRINNKHINPFSKTLNKSDWLPIAAVIFGLALIFILAIKAKVSGLILSLSIMIGILVVLLVFFKPKKGLILIFILSFLIIGLTRYIPLPLGLSMDILLVLLYISLFFKFFNRGKKWNKAAHPLTYLTGLWMLYIVVQIGNPESTSMEAWFYAMRGVALYQFLSIPLIIILFRKPKDLNLFFTIWGILSIVATLKGLQQYIFGVDAFEQRWLDGGAHRTHVLFGKLRIFSFYSDAGQFGASQAHTALVFGIMVFLSKMKKKRRAFYVTVMLMGLTGMIISGTRGAIAVPVCGGALLLVLSKNIKIIVLGTILGCSVYIFFAHTFIGQGNAEIRRMRTAFDPNAPSLKVRLDNQKKLKRHLATRPFGGGVGATGNWGKRFTPNTRLANIATDSWYVQIWADTGIVGLIYYLIMIGYFMLVASYNIMFKLKDKEFKVKITALTCGVMGVLVASYGNGVFCQLPTSTIMFLSLVFIVKSPDIEKEYILTNKNSKKNEL